MPSAARSWRATRSFFFLPCQPAVDALDLATIHYLIDHEQPIEIATYDERLASAADALGSKRWDCG